MTSLLHFLAGLTVTEVMVIHDYFQLVFGDSTRVAIYNDISFIPGPMADVTRIDQFQGKIVTSVIEGEETIDFIFLDGTGLRIDMRRQAYRGPEALELNRPGFPTVVWN